MTVINCITHVPTIDELKAAMDSDQMITAVVALDQEDLVGVGFDGFIDRLSTAATGTELLMDVSYEIIGQSPFGILVTVKGSIQGVIETQEEYNPQELIATEKTETIGDHKFTEVTVKLPQHETDVTLVMPNGQEVAIQIRLEGPTLDLCIDPNEMALDCTNWIGDSMQPAPSIHDDQHVRQIHQICIGLPPEWVDDCSTE
jgi:hypothetical protein